VVLEWWNQDFGADLGEHGVPPEAAAVLDASFVTRRSSGLATALGRGGRA
jgi:hypothetical protein